MPDFQCTLWPDEWFGTSITNCCIEHDLGGSDLELAQCVATQFPENLALFGVVLGCVMLIGLTIFGPIYRKLKR